MANDILGHISPHNLIALRPHNLEVEDLRNFNHNSISHLFQHLNCFAEITLLSWYIVGVEGRNGKDALFDLCLSFICRLALRGHRPRSSVQR